MTTHPGRPARSAGRGLADGARAVPLTVLVVLLVDALTTVVGQAYGVGDLGRAGLVAEGQRLLLVAAAAATMWHRPRLAVVLTAAVVTLVFTVGVTGEELWLLVITAVTAALRANRWQLCLVVLGQAGYSAGLGLLVEQRYPGEGWIAAALMMALAAGALLVGLVARRFLRARDQRRAQVEQLEREQAEIRAVERARLADELQEVMTLGLATIQHQLADATRHPADPDTLRATLSRVDAASRALLTQLRVLLDVLRRDPAPAEHAQAAARDQPQSRWVDLLTARHVRIAATAVFALLAARAAVAGVGSLPDDGLVLEVVGLLACALAVWRPVAAAGAAAALLPVSLLLGAPGHWDVLSTTLLCLVAAVRFRPRGFAAAVLGVVGYACLLLVAAGDDPVNHLLLVGLTGFLAVAAGLAARHFVAAREDALSRLADLSSQRDQVESQERGAVARELHDVVAHSLSVTTMLVMATSLSNDPARLAETVAGVRRSTDAARHELSTLLHALRRDVDQPGAGSLVSPLVSAEALAQQLADNGYRPVLDVDPAADELDPTTQRTLTRIMQEATTNILRYTPAGSVCEFGLRTGPSDVRLTVVSPLAASRPTSDLSLGWGLRGIRERVELTRGSFTAGPERERWVLSVSLPAMVPVERPALLVPAGASEPTPGAEEVRRNSRA